MKHYLKLAIVGLAIAAGASTADAQGTAFTYQGRLLENGAPANGSFDLRFHLYDSLSGGTLVAGPITNAPVAVSNGLFTVTLDFGSGVFPGPARYLQIGARSNGVAVAYTALSPRQDLTPTPYAITSENLDGALAAGSLSGTYTNPVTLNNASDSFTGDGSGLFGVNALTLDGFGPNNFWKTLGNAGTTTGVNFVGTTDNQSLDLRADGARALRIDPGTNYIPYGYPPIPNIVGGSAGNFVIPTSVGNVIAGGGEYVEGITNFITGQNYNFIGSGWNIHITNGYESVIAGGSYNTVGATDSAIGGGNGNTANGTWSTIPGGNGNTAAGTASFAAGQNAQAMHDGAFVWADDSTSASFGSTSPNQFLVRAQFMGVNRTNSLDGNDYFTVRANVTNTWGGINMETAGPGLPWYGYSQAGEIYAYTWIEGTGDNSWYLYDDGALLLFSPQGNFALDQYNENNGFINNGASTGAGLTFGTGSGEGIASKRTTGGNQYGLDFYTSFNNRMSIANNGTVLFNNDLNLQNSGVGLKLTNSVAGVSFGEGPFLWGYIGGALGTVEPDEANLTWDDAGNVWVRENCSVATLTIRGGADLAEPFEITALNKEVPQGAVVVIDDENPGRLKLSDQPYDTRVAGVVSGANGINPGIQMQQQGLLEGGKNVALTGRVYVQADASNGAIHPGDLLTTSATPGHAMKVADHAKAQGAILGKAMTGLKDGKGMVLVLVTLQ